MELAIAWHNAAQAGRNRTLTEAQARKVLSEIVERSTGEKMQFHSCRKWMAEWLESKKGSLRPGSMVIYEGVINGFLQHLGSRADMPLASISSTDVRSFRDSLARGKISASTLNDRIREVLSSPFHRARTVGLIPVNPCALVDPLAETEEHHRAPFTSEQVTKILQHAADDWKGMVLAGYYTGLRLGDCARIRWGMIDLEKSVLSITPTKARDKSSKIMIPLHAEFVTWLKTQDRGIANAPLFPDLASKKVNALGKAFGRLMTKAGVKGSIRSGKGRSVNSLTFHSLRHSFVSALANAGIAAELRQKLSGHADEKIHAKYTHHEIETLRGAVDKLPKVGG